MTLRMAHPDDAAAVARIYAPIVRETTISFELEPPDEREMAARIARTLATLPWLVSVDEAGVVDGYVYAGRHREPGAYQWSVNVSAYVRADRRGRGVAKQLYGELFAQLIGLGYFRAFAGIALPNAASVALHRSAGFEAVGIYREVGFKHGAWRDVAWWQRRLQDGVPTALPRRPGDGSASP